MRRRYPTRSRDLAESPFTEQARSRRRSPCLCAWPGCRAYAVAMLERIDQHAIAGRRCETAMLSVGMQGNGEVERRAEYRVRRTLRRTALPFSRALMPSIEVVPFRYIPLS